MNGIGRWRWTMQINSHFSETCAIQFLAPNKLNLNCWLSLHNMRGAFQIAENITETLFVPGCLMCSHLSFIIKEVAFFPFCFFCCYEDSRRGSRQIGQTTKLFVNSSFFGNKESSGQYLIDQEELNNSKKKVFENLNLWYFLLCWLR